MNRFVTFSVGVKYRRTSRLQFGPVTVQIGDPTRDLFVSTTYYNKMCCDVLWLLGWRLHWCNDEMSSRLNYNPVLVTFLDDMEEWTIRGRGSKVAHVGLSPPAGYRGVTLRNFPKTNQHVLCPVYSPPKKSVVFPPWAQKSPRFCSFKPLKKKKKEKEKPKCFNEMSGEVTVMITAS